MKITFLGTVGSFISKDRTYPSILINNNLLLDCGEGTTQNLLKIDMIQNITTICITHLHNDHFMGIFSLLWYYWINERKETLKIIGPADTKSTIEKILDLIHTPERMKSFEIEYIPLKDIIEIQSIEEENYTIKANKTSHLDPTFALRVEENGKSVCYSGDTKPIQGLITFFDNCNLLIHESTFPDEFQNLAHQLYHSTPHDIADIANKSNCINIALIHISPTFHDQIDKFYTQVRKHFTGTIFIPDDLSMLEI
jgi:ribonuclease Z